MAKGEEAGVWCHLSLSCVLLSVLHSARSLSHPRGAGYGTLVCTVSAYCRG